MPSPFIFPTPGSSDEPVNILPDRRVVGAVQWDIETLVRSAQPDNAAPSHCPVNRLFCGRVSPFPGPAVGSFLPAFLPSWSKGTLDSPLLNAVSATSPPFSLLGRWIPHIARVSVSGCQPGTFHSRSRKLSTRFIGPLPILRVIDPAAVQLKLLPTLRRIHLTFHMSRVKPFICNLLCPAPKPPTPPRVIDGPETFTVNRLLAVRRRGRGFQFLVDWEGYGSEERCWVPFRDIVEHTLVRDFLKTPPVLPVKTPGGVLKRGGYC